MSERLNPSLKIRKRSASKSRERRKNSKKAAGDRSLEVGLTWRTPGSLPLETLDFDCRRKGHKKSYGRVVDREGFIGRGVPPEAVYHRLLSLKEQVEEACGCK